MGFFDSWKNEAEPDPQPAPQPAPRPVAQPAAQPAAQSRPKTERAPQPVQAQQPARRTHTIPASPPSTDMPDFGIQKTIELMRQLPPDNVELVVSVVKKTLESMNIDVASIIDDAKAKQAKIEGRVSGLESEIIELKEEIAGREEEIKALKADYAETKQVRERLELSQRPAKAQAKPKPSVKPSIKPKPAAAPAPITAKHKAVNPTTSAASPKAAGEIG